MKVFARRGATLPVAFLACGLSIFSLAGCRGERDAAAEAPNETSEGDLEGATATAASALQVATYDFLANASNAFWHNNDGGLVWGSNGSAGVCMATAGVLENGVSYPSFLYTHPKLVANGFTHGAYTVTIPAASLHPTVTATFGFKQGASGTNGATFSLTTKVNGSWVTIFSQTKSYTGALSTKTADLTPYAGQTIQLFLNVDAGSNSDYDWAAWTDARVTADSNTTPTSCTIGGVGYPEGAVNPAVSCQICDPGNSSSAWTTRGDACFIGGVCYAAADTDALGCRVCDPNVSQTGMTSKSACNKLIIAVTNSATDGSAFGGLSGADAACASQGAPLGLPGKWQAMLSSSGTSGRDYRDAVASQDWSKPVVNLKGETMYSSWEAIFGNQVWPVGLSMYRFGNATNIVGSAYTGFVWTGSVSTGVWDVTSGHSNCENWTQDSAWFLPTNAKVGDFTQRKLVDSEYSDSSSNTQCGYAKRLACVLVPSPAVVTAKNYDGSAMGVLRGKSQGDAYAFLGVPYAASPTGSNRFAPPQLVAPWTAIRNAFSQPRPCAQKGFFLSLPNGYIGSEDCLYLNVWTPKTAAPGSNLPVMVFFHGGGLMFGGTAAVDDVVGQGNWDGDRLAAAQNMIVVTVQTRLAALGYLASSELSADSTSRTSTTGDGTSGNYGLLDAIQSLKWVKKNIYAFGGDPNLVTLAGQSGGATLATMLLSSPRAKDPADSNKPYFSRAMMMSGFYEEPSMQTRYTQADAIMPSLKAGCEDDSTPINCLRTAPLSNFVNAAGDFLMFVPNVLNQYVSSEMAFGLPFGPSIDGYVLPDQPRTSFSLGTHNKVPVIMGSTQKEFSSFMVTGVAGLLHAVQTLDFTDMIYLATCNGSSPSSLSGRAKLNLGDALGATALSLYPCSGVVLGPTIAYSDAMTHAQYQCPVHRSAVALAGGQTQPVRRYMYTHGADRIGVFQNLLGLVPQIGAAHALDSMYVFNSHESYVLGLRTYLGPSPRERDLTNRYQAFIRAFAASGDPNNATLGTTWTQYNPAQDNYLSLKVVHEGNNASDPGPEMLSGIDLGPGGVGLSDGVGTSNCKMWDANLAL